MRCNNVIYVSALLKRPSCGSAWALAYYGLADEEAARVSQGPGSSSRLYKRSSFV
jgi:hypothetical protein